MAKKAKTSKRKKASKIGRKPAEEAPAAKAESKQPGEEGYDPETMGPKWRPNTRHKPRGKNWRRHAQR